MNAPPLKQSDHKSRKIDVRTIGWIVMRHSSVLLPDKARTTVCCCWNQQNVAIMMMGCGHLQVDIIVTCFRQRNNSFLFHSDQNTIAVATEMKTIKWWNVQKNASATIHILKKVRSKRHYKYCALRLRKETFSIMCGLSSSKKHQQIDIYDGACTRIRRCKTELMVNVHREAFSTSGTNLNKKT